MNINKKILALLVCGGASHTWAMEEISEVELSRQTAQAGITIEQDLNVAIGSVVYSDSDNNGAGIGLFGVKIGQLDGITSYTADNVIQGTPVNLVTTVDVDVNGLVLGTKMDPLDVVVTTTAIGNNRSGNIGLVGLYDIQLTDDVSNTISLDGNGGIIGATASTVTLRSGGASNDGVTIDQSARVRIGTVGYSEDVGNGGGSIFLQNVTLYGTNGYGSAIDINGLTIDVNSSDKLVIGTPAIEANLWISEIDIAENIGSFAVNDIYIAPSTAYIYGH